MVGEDNFMIWKNNFMPGVLNYVPLGLEWHLSLFELPLFILPIYTGMVLYRAKDRPH